MSIDCLRDRVSPLPNSNADEVWPVLLPEYAEIRMPWLSLQLRFPSVHPSDIHEARNGPSRIEVRFAQTDSGA